MPLVNEKLYCNNFQLLILDCHNILTSLIIAVCLFLFVIPLVHRNSIGVQHMPNILMMINYSLECLILVDPKLI